MKRFFFHGPKRYWVVSILVPILLFVLACGPGEEPTPTPTKAVTTVATPTPTVVATPTPTPAGGIPQRGGTLIQMGSWSTQWDQIRQTQHTTGTVGPGTMFLTPMYDEGPTDNKRYVCDICDKWSLEDGGKTMVFHLRGDATFHDGKPITSKDMKYSLEKVMGRIDNITALRAGWMKEYIVSIDTPDDRTMKLNLARPAPVLPSLLTVVFVGIEPNGTTAADLAAPPLGPGNKYTSGPFYLKETVKDSHSIYERDPNYFKKGLPYLDSIKVQVFPDAAASTTAFLTGKIDFWATYGKPSPQFLPLLFQKKEQGKFSLIRLPQGGTLLGVVLGFKNPLWADIRLRQAVNLAVDRVDWGNTYYGGQIIGAMLFTYPSPWGIPEEEIWNILPGWGTEAKKQAEIEQAKELLKSAGYAPGTLNLPFLTPPAASYGAETTQRQMIKAGFNATLEVVESSVNNSRQGVGDFVISLYPAAHAVYDPDEVLGNYYKTGAIRNFGQLSDPWIDKQFLLVSAETDPAKRKQLFFEFRDYVLKNALHIGWPDGLQDYWFTSKLRGYEPGLTIYKSSNWRGESWWLAK